MDRVRMETSVRRRTRDSTSGDRGFYLRFEASAESGKMPVGTFAPQPQQPLVLTMNCLNGYFHFPYFNSLAEELLKAEGKGAIVAVSPSGLSLNEPAHRFHKALLTELTSGRHRRLGDAFLSAQSAYAASGGFAELLSIYHLFGDPALTLK